MHVAAVFLKMMTESNWLFKPIREDTAWTFCARHLVQMVPAVSHLKGHHAYGNRTALGIGRFHSKSFRVWLAAGKVRASKTSRSVISDDL